MVLATSMSRPMTLRAQTTTSTPVPFEVIQSPQWSPTTVYGIVFGIVTVFLGIPGALMAIHALRKHARAQASVTSQGKCRFGKSQELH